MLRKIIILAFGLALCAVSAWLFLHRDTTPEPASFERTETLTGQPQEQSQQDFGHISLAGGYTRYESDSFTVDYPTDWEMERGSNRRWIFKSADSTLSLYAVPKSSQEDLGAWIQSTQSAYFDTFDFLTDNVFDLRGSKAVIAQYCDEAISYNAYLEGRDNFFILWTSGIETDLRILLEHLYIIGASSEPAVLPEQFALYDEPACHPGTEPGPEPDPATVCDYSDSSTNSCCNEFTERDVSYWSCSANFTGDYGNCTWWTAYKRPDVGDAAADHPGFGDACNWDYWAYLDGLLVDDCPRVGDIFVYDVQGCPGHVASVEQVLWDEGKIGVSEMNWCSTCLQTREFLLADRKYVHGSGPQVVIYPDPPNDISVQFTAAGSCNGKQAFHASKPGLYEFDLDEAAAILVPAGWSVRLYGQTPNEEICLEQSGLLSDYAYEQTGQLVEDNVSQIETFTESGCKN